MKMKTVLIFVVVLGVAFGSKFPSDWKICKQKEGDEFNKCLQEAVQDVLPKLKDGNSDLALSPLEPISLPSVTIGEGKGAVNVVQNYKNFQIFGIPTAKVEKVDAKYDGNGLKIKLQALISEIKILADYDFNGRILLLPIVGNGKAEVTLKNLKVTADYAMEKYEKEGASYLKVTSLKVTLEPEHVVYYFGNLFNGDKALGDGVNTLLNDHDLEVFNDVAGGYAGVMETVFTDYCDRIFSKVPVDDIF